MLQIKMEDDMKKFVVGLLILGAVLVYSNIDTIKQDWRMSRLKIELKDAYSQSRYYEKMSRHGMVVPEEKWEEIHEKVAEVKAEMQFIRNMKEIDNL